MCLIFNPRAGKCGTGDEAELPLGACIPAAFHAAVSEHCREKDTDLDKCASPRAQCPPGFLTQKLVFPNTVCRR